MLLSEEIDIKTITIITNLVELWVNLVFLAAILNCSFRQEAIVRQLAFCNFWIEHLLNTSYANFHACLIYIKTITIITILVELWVKLVFSAAILNCSFRQEAIAWQLASRNFWIQHLLNTLYANFHAFIRRDWYQNHHNYDDFGRVMGKSGIFGGHFEF